MRSLRVFILAAIFSAIGLSVFFYKHLALEFPLTPDTNYNSWYVEMRVDLTSKNRWRASGAPLLFTMQLPHASDRYVLVDENIVASGFGYEIIEKGTHGNRYAEFAKRRPDTREAIFYRAIVYELDSPGVAKDEPPSPPSSPYSKRNRPKLGPEEKEEPIYVAIDALIDEAKAKSATPATYVREIYRLSRSDRDDRIQLIRDTINPKITAAEIAAILLEADDIPTRNAHGVQLGKDQRKAQPVTWLEVYIKDRWQAVDPETYGFGLKDKYLVLWYGNGTLYSVEGQVRAEMSVSVQQNRNNALTRALWKSGQISSALLTFSFHNLPLDTQLVFKVLIMLPLGGLVLAFMRQIIGIKTFGTFMPVLIAIAFRETGIISGLIMFLVVVGTGLVVRSYFDHLKLLFVPRLAAVLTVVVIVLSMIAMITNELGIVVGLSIALFPIVILTMTIERMSLMWEEYGPRDAIKTCAGSLVAAIVAYFAMNSELLSHLLFAFPELLLVVLSLALLLGRYNYYKLTEYLRFRQLQRSLAELEAQETAKKAARIGSTKQGR
jgi:hypothetical protein